MIADWHFFAKYIFILENEAQQFQIKNFPNFNIWRINMQSIPHVVYLW
jgi:hypothetical protein